MTIHRTMHCPYCQSNVAHESLVRQGRCVDCQDIDEYLTRLTRGEMNIVKAREVLRVYSYYLTQQARGCDIPDRVFVHMHKYRVAFPELFELKP